MIKKKYFLPLVIAEVGVNHNGNLDFAKELIKVAAESGADVVKFQSFNSSELSTENARLAPYQSENISGIDNQKDLLKALELNFDQLKELTKEAKKFKIEFLSTAFSLDQLKLLDKLNMKRLKIPSGEITNIPFIKEIGKRKLPTILSTGMSDIDEIKIAYNTLLDAGLRKKDLTILHCISEYPTPLENANLKSINTLRKYFDTDVGFSDHTIGNKASIIAASLGAKVIEKHITLDKSLEGPDHKSSMEPEEFKKFVYYLKSVSKWLGDGIKKPTKNELINRKIVRKSLVASEKISKGDLFTKKNITAKRPESGISPKFAEEFYKIRADRNYEIDDFLKWPEN